MECFYICPRETWEQSHSLFVESHYIVLDDGSLLVCGQCPSKAAEIAWKTQPGVEALKDGEIPPHHIAKMQRFGIEKGHTLEELERRVSQIHPLVCRTGRG